MENANFNLPSNPARSRVAITLPLEIVPGKAKAKGREDTSNDAPCTEGCHLLQGLTKMYNFTWELESKANHSNVSKAPI